MNPDAVVEQVRHSAGGNPVFTDGKASEKPMESQGKANEKQTQTHRFPNRPAVRLSARVRLGLAEMKKAGAQPLACGSYCLSFPTGSESKLIGDLIAGGAREAKFGSEKRLVKRHEKERPDETLLFIDH
jgi:hypothetical protein